MPDQFPNGPLNNPELPSGLAARQQRQAEYDAIHAQQAKWRELFSRAGKIARIALEFGVTENVALVDEFTTPRSGKTPAKIYDKGTLGWKIVSDQSGYDTDDLPPKNAANLSIDEDLISPHRGILISNTGGLAIFNAAGRSGLDTSVNFVYNNPSSVLYRAPHSSVVPLDIFTMPPHESQIFRLKKVDPIGGQVSFGLGAIEAGMNEFVIRHQIDA